MNGLDTGDSLNGRHRRDVFEIGTEVAGRYMRGVQDLRV